MPEFFQGMPSGVYDNIYDDLDDSPVTWHITEPVDPTEYQNEWLGDVVSIRHSLPKPLSASLRFRVFEALPQVKSQKTPPNVSL